MKIQVLSDLHLEFGKFECPKVDRDLLILAGDISVGKRALEFITEQCKIGPVVYILGNHEYYEQEFDWIKNQWKNMNLKNLYFLENQQVQFDSVRIIGATLWTDFNQNDNHSKRLAQVGMSDYHIIRYGNRLLLPDDTLDAFYQSAHYIRQQLGTPFSGKTLIVTHHMPSYRSIAPRFAEDDLNPAFASDLDSLIREFRPEYWIHGHTHVSFNYLLDHTRVLCNPRGYLGYELNREFDPEFVITL